jgi:hypothetical protein
MLAEQQSFDVDVFVEAGPMYSITGPAYLKTSAFARVCHSGDVIPPDGNGTGAAVLEINRQRVVRDFYV